MKKMLVIPNVFPKLQTVKDLVRPLSEKHVSKHALTVNILKDPKHLWKLYESTFITLFYQPEKNEFGKYLLYWYVKS